MFNGRNLIDLQLPNIQGFLGFNIRPHHKNPPNLLVLENARTERTVPRWFWRIFRAVYRYIAKSIITY